jgi:hypothetical protein
MISFFGIDPKMKHVPIPLWMVGLIGGMEDLKWAADHSLIIDQEAFRVFQQSTLLSVFSDLVWSRDYDSREEKNKVCVQALKDARKVKSSDEVWAYLKKYQQYHFKSRLWSDVIESEIFTNPHKYIEQVINRMDATAHYEHRKALKTLKPSARYFTHYYPKDSSNINFARICCGGVDPFKISMELMRAWKVGNKKGLQIFAIEENGQTKYAATFHMSDPKSIFYCYHFAAASSIDVVSVAGVDAVSSAITDAGPETITDLIDMPSNRVAEVIKTAQVSLRRAVDGSLEEAMAAVESGEVDNVGETWDESERPTARRVRRPPVRRPVVLNDDEEDSED